MPAAEGHIEGLRFSEALDCIWFVIRKLNAYVDKSAPWKETDRGKLDTILYNLALGLKIIAVYIYPFMPESALKLRAQLGLTGEFTEGSFDKEIEWNASASGLKVDKTGPLFPRVE